MRYFLPVLLSSAISAQAECFTWSEARVIIPAQNLISGAMAFRVASSKTQTQKVGVTSLKLCNEFGRFHYRAKTVDENNKVVLVIIDAKTGLRWPITMDTHNKIIDSGSHPIVPVERGSRKCH